MNLAAHLHPQFRIQIGQRFVKQQNALPEIFTVGHRNIQSAAFDEKGRLWTVEHGAQGGDELNLLEKGKNYGWAVISYGEEYSGEPIPGNITQKEGYEQPVYYWDPVIAASSLAFYQGNLFPQWKTSVLVGGVAGRAVFRLELSKDDKVVNEEALLVDLKERIRDVRVFPDGAVYVLTDGPGAKLLKLTPARPASQVAHQAAEGRRLK